MHKLKHIFTFIAPYVKPYWGRLLAGLFFGVLFGASNGMVLCASNEDKSDVKFVDAPADSQPGEHSAHGGLPLPLP